MIDLRSGLPQLSTIPRTLPVLPTYIYFCANTETASVFLSQPNLQPTQKRGNPAGHAYVKCLLACSCSKRGRSRGERPTSRQRFECLSQFPSHFSPTMGSSGRQNHVRSCIHKGVFLTRGCQPNFSRFVIHVKIGLFLYTQRPENDAAVNNLNSGKAKHVFAAFNN